MTPGSLQQRLFRIAKRDGLSTREAAAYARISPAEAALIDKDDAREPPCPECFVIPRGMACNAVGGLRGTPLGEAAVERFATCR